ncbi:MAG: SUMF1/EgtB/PvdO family nonheme iron enzyme [Lewinellaceae bacterium]|nr:SUMF1/EgtB/PvdO family nonheme iron enzyme [Lewinellaceae bacterium]
MGRFEVTVEEYLRFYQETDDVRNKYDSAVWTKDFPYAYNEPMTKNYFRLLHYRKYPVVGLTWEQAMRFCRWKSEALNALLENTGYAVECTLPTDAEWQYAACGPDLQDKEDPGAKQRFFSMGVFFLAPHLSKGEYQLQCNSGNAITPQGLPLLSYASDGGLYTLPVEHFEPNGYGLYQMSGNVAEWTSDNYSVDYTTIEDAQQKYKDKPEMLQRFTPVFPSGTYDDYKIVKGGSWADSPFYMQIGVSKIQHPEKASSMVGFRPVVRIYRK